MVIFLGQISFTNSAILARLQILAAAQYFSSSANNICLAFLEFVPHPSRLPTIARNDLSQDIYKGGLQLLDVRTF